MILWTIQSENAWQDLIKNGYLSGTKADVSDEIWDMAYCWMTGQMKKRLGSRPNAECFPIWAWYQWRGAKRRRPDLRAGGHLAKHETGVRIEFECSENAALLSDFELWHYVLNYWYLPQSVSDDEAFESELANKELSFFTTKPLPDQEYHEKIVHSWERIFDLNWFQSGLSAPRDQKSIQATIWQVKLEQVRNHTFFKSR